MDPSNAEGDKRYGRPKLPERGSADAPPFPRPDGAGAWWPTAPPNCRIGRPVAVTPTGRLAATPTEIAGSGGAVRGAKRTTAGWRRTRVAVTGGAGGCRLPPARPVDSLAGGRHDAGTRRLW